MAFLFSGQTTDDGQNEKQNIFSQGASTQAESGSGAQNDVFNKTTGGGSSTGSMSSVSRGTPPAVSQQAKPVSGGSGGYNPKAAQSAYSQIGPSLRLPTTSISRAQGSVQEV